MIDDELHTEDARAAKLGCRRRRRGDPPEDETTFLDEHGRRRKMKLYDDVTHEEWGVLSAGVFDQCLFFHFEPLVNVFLFLGIPPGKSN